MTNPHFDKATALLDDISHGVGRFGQTLAPTTDQQLAEAQIHATLALVHEQRTANLLQASDRILNHFGDYTTVLHENLLERLDLDIPEEWEDLYGTPAK